MDRLFSWMGTTFGFLTTNSQNTCARSRQTLSSTEPLVISPMALPSLHMESFREPSRGVCSWQTLFSQPHTKTDSLTVGIASCPPKVGYLACHRHIQAEMYHVISGRGVVKINGTEYGIEKGSVVFIPGNAEHGVQNVDETQELKWLYCFAVDGFEEIVYRFSGE